MQCSLLGFAVFLPSCSVDPVASSAKPVFEYRFVAASDSSDGVSCEERIVVRVYRLLYEIKALEVCKEPFLTIAREEIASARIEEWADYDDPSYHYYSLLLDPKRPLGSRFAREHREVVVTHPGPLASYAPPVFWRMGVHGGNFASREEAEAICSVMDLAPEFVPFDSESFRRIREGFLRTRGVSPSAP